MTSPTHIVIGMTAGFTLTRMCNLPLTVLGLVCLLIGSLAPDLDADSGALARPGKILDRFLPRWLAKFIDGFFQAFAKVVNRLLGHRGPLHWPLIGISLCILGIVFNKEALVWFGFGYLSHILADYCTTGGIPLLGPFSRHIYRWSPLRTGSKAEILVFVVFLMAMLLLGWPLLPAETRFWLIKYYNLLQARHLLMPIVLCLALLCGLGLLSARSRRRF